MHVTLLVIKSEDPIKVPVHRGRAFGNSLIVEHEGDVWTAVRSLLKDADHNAFSTLFDRYPKYYEKYPRANGLAEAKQSHINLANYRPKGWKPECTSVACYIKKQHPAARTAAYSGYQDGVKPIFGWRKEQLKSWLKYQWRHR
jgi:hypothetical protein